MSLTSLLEHTGASWPDDSLWRLAVVKIQGGTYGQSTRPGFGRNVVQFLRCWFGGATRMADTLSQ